MKLVVLLSCLLFAGSSYGQSVPWFEEETPAQLEYRQNKEADRAWEKSAPVRQVTAIQSVASEVQALRKEVAMLRKLLEQLLKQNPVR
jgi:ubiquinone biosynthesis protein UbiJ